MPIALIINDVPIECINTAAITYQVPATLIISILKTENGKNGLASENKDGSIDYGPMQINSRWLNKIAHFGYTQSDIQFNPCKNIAVGTWILSQNIAEGKNLWNGVGNYHSHTFELNKSYNYHIRNFHNRLENIINNSK
jgi:soluble lytic murein transglycosylase-like protein